MTLHIINDIKVHTSSCILADWSAVDDNYDVDCDGDGYFSSCPVGRGRTEQQAIDDLLEQIEELAE
jgi:hypothetical protein